MNQDKLWQEIESLPLQAKREVADFVAFLRTRYKLPCSADKTMKTELSDEPFIGIWRNREDMEDSCKWVRTLRDREWASS